MRKLRSYGAVLMCCLSLSMPVTAVVEQTTITVQAHSGRTDGSGGHRDNKNKSGLGSYHYHCGGYPAHLHEGGVCPYRDGGQTAQSSGVFAAADVQPETSAVTEDLMNTYAAVFDAGYYYNANPDLQSAVGSDSLKLFEHFCSSGMAEGRRGCEDFDVHVYRDQNPDLYEAFGDDLKQYYDHYVQSGHDEGRTHC